MMEVKDRVSTLISRGNVGEAIEIYLNAVKRTNDEELITDVTLISNQLTKSGEKKF